jgi:hypothetical protein
VCAQTSAALAERFDITESCTPHGITDLIVVQKSGYS